MMTEEIFLRILNYGSKAPSSHNTQPWKFRRENDSILVYPDFSRSLPVVDADNHALFISLGCAIENIVIAAAHFGYDANVESPEGHPGDPVRIELKPSSTDTRGSDLNHAHLFAHIKTRQVTKGAYREDPLDHDAIEKIRKIARDQGIGMRLILPGDESEKLLPLVIEGSNRQFGNKAFVGELVEWIRFSEREALKKGDGIRNATMGMPGTGRAIGNLVMKHMVSPKSEAGRWEKLFRRSAGFVLFTAERNEPACWTRLGRSFQRFGLETTAMGLKHAHMNMPLEEEAVREKVVETFGLNGTVPLLLLRIGYADPAPYSFRRNLHETLIK